MSNEPTDKSEQAIAVLGLLAQTGQGFGPEPSRGEIRLYLSGELGEERGEQIKSHIAHNPAIYDLLLDVSAEGASANLEKEVQSTPAAEADESHSDVALSEEASNVVSLDSRRTPKAVWLGAGALAATLLIAAVVVFQADSTPEQPRQRIATGQPAPTANNPALEQAEYMRAGYRYGYSQTEQGTAMTVAGGCEDCSSLEASLVRFGATVADIEEACLASQPVPAAKATDLSALAVGDEALRTPPWSTYAQTLHSAAQKSPQALCRSISQLTPNLK